MKTAILLCCLVATSANAQTKVTVFVTPQVRDGFSDVDSGILESIKDIKGEVLKSPLFTLAPNADTAAIVLTVVGRRMAGDNGSIGIPIGTMTMFMPVKRRAIDSILRYGTYEKPMTSEDEGHEKWSYAARSVVRDMTVWVEANRAAMK